MTEVSQTGVEMLLGQGFLGLAVLVLGFVLYRAVKLYLTDMAAMRQEVKDLQEKRVEDGKVMTTLAQTTTAALESLADLIRNRGGA